MSPSVSSDQQQSVTGAETQQSNQIETTAAAVQPSASETAQQLPKERVGILNKCMPNNVAAPLIGIGAQVTTTSDRAPGSSSSCASDSSKGVFKQNATLKWGLKAPDTDLFTFCDCRGRPGGPDPPIIYVPGSWVLRLYKYIYGCPQLST
eukprot:SAG31_NODE_637_length_13337_cov_23.061867_2_plen_150_part_00